MQHYVLRTTHCKQCKDHFKFRYPSLLDADDDPNISVRCPYCDCRFNVDLSVYAMNKMTAYRGGQIGGVDNTAPIELTLPDALSGSNEE